MTPNTAATNTAYSTYSNTPPYATAQIPRNMLAVLQEVQGQRGERTGNHILQHTATSSSARPNQWWTISGHGRVAEPLPFVNGASASSKTMQSIV
jgi:hypothetical protein